MTTANSDYIADLEAEVRKLQTYKDNQDAFEKRKKEFDENVVYADNAPDIEIQEVRLSLFSKGSYTKLKNTLIRAILAAEITITDRRYVGHEDDTGYHNYAIDVAKHYEMEE